MRSQISSCLDRRVLLKALTAGAGLLGASRLSLISAAAAGPTPLVNHAETVFVPGQFFWDLGRAPEGRVVIIVSIPRQLVFVYRNGALIGLSTCSTGMPGHSTPAGMFTVINKFKVHRSAKYGDDMPNTLRLTRRGIALHGGDIPGYPTSHGCVHLPLPFADDLFELTATGTPVVIGGDPAHRLVSGAGVAPAAGAGSVVAVREAARAIAPSGPDADTSILISAADKRLYVVQDGTILAAGPVAIKDPGAPLGSNLFVWRGGNLAGTPSIFTGGGFQPVPAGATAANAAVLERINSNARAADTIETLIHSGTILLITDEPLNPTPNRPSSGPRRRRRASRTRRHTHARTGRHRRHSG
jgi:L,D-transpeptidase-like protein